jgi:hypothetical protein
VHILLIAHQGGSYVVCCALLAMASVCLAECGVNLPFKNPSASPLLSDTKSSLVAQYPFRCHSPRPAPPRRLRGLQQGPAAAHQLPDGPDHLRLPAAHLRHTHPLHLLRVSTDSYQSSVRWGGDSCCAAVHRVAQRFAIEDACRRYPVRLNFPIFTTFALVRMCCL